MRALLQRLSIFLVFGLLAPLVSGQEVGVFELHFDAESFGEISKEGFEGEVFIAFAPDKRSEPRQAMLGWFGAPPVMRFDLKGLQQGAVVKLRLSDATLTAPLKWDEAVSKKWHVQAIARVSRTGREPGHGNGDVYSAASEISFSPKAEGVVALHLDQVVEEHKIEETERLRQFDFVSPALSKFHGFEYTMHAGVLLPKNYDAKKTYPVLYSVTGFGGSHHSIGRFQRSIAEGDPLEQCIIVVPDANNRYGHSVFCDSTSIGPWGQALVYELIPALEKKYGGVGPKQRYVTGVSSGGWSSLWLQVTYPEEFNGCWSHVPDPIDFHDFQYVDIYEPLPDGTPRNMFVDEKGELRPLARRDGKVMMTMKEFAVRENVLNPGGQLRSFDGTFSAPLPDGTPRRMFDVETGEVDHELAKTWRKYDISNTLLTRWDELRPLLADKIHIYAGELDTFHLEGAVIRFKALAEKAGLLEDMVVEVVPGMVHRQYAAGHADLVKTIAARQAAAKE